MSTKNQFARKLPHYLKWYGVQNKCHNEGPDQKANYNLQNSLALSTKNYKCKL